MDKQKLSEMLIAMSRKMSEQKDYLTELDNAIADGDHGINMARGFAAVESRLPELAEKDIGFVLRTVGMTLVSVVAGSAGPLYGTAFMRAGMAMNGKETASAADLPVCLKAAIDGVMQRGKAVQGEKTMLDAMIPAYEAIQKAFDNGAEAQAMLCDGIAAARKGVEYTATIAATKGRASYIGERSIGHIDPGAASFTFLLEAMLSVL